MTKLVYRKIYAVVPKTFVDRYAAMPWGDVLAAAERGADGSSIHRGRPPLWQGLADNQAPDPPDVAYLSEGQHEWVGRTVLHQQNWSDRWDAFKAGEFVGGEGGDPSPA